MNLFVALLRKFFQPKLVGEAAKINDVEEIAKIADGTNPLEILRGMLAWTPGSYLLSLPDKDVWSIVSSDFFETHFAFTSPPVPGELTPCKQIRHFNK